MAFDQLFNDLYNKLVLFGKQYTLQAETAEEIVSELFVKIWLKRVQLSKVLNPEVYLYVSVKNACLNFIRSEKRKSTLFSDELNEGYEQLIAVADTNLEDKELFKQLAQAVANLPEQRRLIFVLVKENGLKSVEVAKILGISKRTVENQLYKAIKTLADALSIYLGYHPQEKTALKKLPNCLSAIFF